MSVMHWDGITAVARRQLSSFLANPLGYVFILAFVLVSGLVFFAWGEIYSLFPALCTDIFGRRFATTNYGLLYTAKGTAALLVPFASVLRDAAGGWQAVFWAAAAMNAAAALLAWFVLRPLRQGVHTRRSAALAVAAE